MRLIGNGKGGFHHLSDGVLTQLLQCESCGDYTDDVAWIETIRVEGMALDLGMGLCAMCYELYANHAPKEVQA